MRLSIVATSLLFVVVSHSVSAFTPQPQPERSFPTLPSTVQVAEQQQVQDEIAESVSASLETQQKDFLPLTESQINARLARQMAKLQEKDRTSKMTKEVIIVMTLCVCSCPCRCI
jgi:hypothetical protein